MCIKLCTSQGLRYYGLVRTINININNGENKQKTFEDDETIQWLTGSTQMYCFIQKQEYSVL